MMTVSMNNLAAPSRELVQRLHKKNIELDNRRRKSAQARLPLDPNAWQQMRENYEAIILEDHAFSEKHEIEYALWQLHYRRIDELRTHHGAASASAVSGSPGGKGPSRPDRIKKIRFQFKNFLSEATGFYHDLILKIQAKYGLPLGRFSDDPQNLITVGKDGKKQAEVKNGLVSCHRCLIYLGDLARYKGLYGDGESKTREFAAASSYYMQAASLLPSSGNPHHQLAIIASYSGDDLGSIYRYFRSLAVSNPFKTARDNLIIAFEKNRETYSQFQGDSGVSLAKIIPTRKSGKGRGKGVIAHPPEDKVDATSTKGSISNVPEIYKSFCIRFVRLNGILFTRTSLETFAEVFSLVSKDLHELLSSGLEEKLNFGKNAMENELLVVRLVAILIFTVHNVHGETEKQSYAEILQRSVLLQNAFTATFEIMGLILERAIQLNDPSSSYLLPGILIFIEWLACRPDIAVGSDLEEKQAIARSFFWNHCIHFLNKLLSGKSVSVAEDGDETCFFNMTSYDERETDNRLALWEDFELRGFLPVVPAQLILDFSRNHTVVGDGRNKETKARVQRILAAGKALANSVLIDDKGIYFSKKLKKFIIGVEPQASDDIVLACSSEMTKPNGVIHESPTEMTDAELAHPKETPFTQGEEEDEEIVFKPTISEKSDDVPAPKLITCEHLRHGENIANGECFSGYTGSNSAPPSNFNLQSAFDVDNHVPISSCIVQNALEANNHDPVNKFNLHNSMNAKNHPLSSFGMPTRNQMSISGASNRLVDKQAQLSNGVNSLSIVGNGYCMHDEFKNGLESFQPPAHRAPFPTSGNLTSNSVFTDKIIASETVLPSKFDSVTSSGFNCASMSSEFDSVMSSGFNTTSMIPNLSVALHTNLRKNPVSRPVRHRGPPPGFSTAQPKQFNEVRAGFDLKDDMLPVDDYSWLDDYHLSSSTKEMTPNKSISHMVHIDPHVTNENPRSNGSITFPFPGKQVPAMQAHDEIQKTWQEYQLLEQLKKYQGRQQLQHFQQANQQSALPLEQYQGQSLWSGSFFV